VFFERGIRGSLRRTCFLRTSAAFGSAGG
jgi:hypothetical protein